MSLLWGHNMSYQEAFRNKVAEGLKKGRYHHCEAHVAGAFLYGLWVGHNLSKLEKRIVVESNS